MQKRRPTRLRALAIMVAVAAALVRCTSFGVDANGTDSGASSPACGQGGCDASLVDARDANARSDADTTSADASDASVACVTDADVDADSRNCGRCGHDCLTGQCNAGKCQPYTLDNGFPYAAEITVEGTTALWTTGFTSGGVYACPRTGCVPGLVTFATGLDGTANIAADQGSVYFSNPDAVDASADGVFMCARTGCGAGPTKIVPSVSARTLRADGTSLFYVVDYTKIYTCAAPSCATPSVIATGQSIHDLVLDGNTMYWVDAFDLYACQKSTCSATKHKLFTASVDPPALQRIAFGGGRVFTVQAPSAPFLADGKILSCPASSVSSCAPSVVATGIYRTFGFAADDSGVYFSDIGTAADQTTGYIATCPIAGCPLGAAQKIVANVPNAASVALDARAIYFSRNGGYGPPMVIAKP